MIYVLSYILLSYPVMALCFCIATWHDGWCPGPDVTLPLFILSPLFAGPIVFIVVYGLVSDAISLFQRRH